VITSQINILSKEEAFKLALAFTGIDHHQFQDPLRSIFVDQSCFTCKIEDEYVAYAVIDFNRFKRASLWFAPVIKKNLDVDPILKELFKCLAEKGIWYLVFQPENNEISEKMQIFLNRSKARKICSLKGWATAIKSLNLPMEQLFKNFTQNHRYCINRAKKNGITTKSVQSEEEFGKLLKIFHLMYEQRKIHYYANDLTKRLMGEFSFINESRKGNVIIAEKDGNILGGIILIYSGNSAFYTYGAMDKNEKLPVMYAAINHALSEVSKQNIPYLDFGGYLTDDSDSQFLAVNRFKNGFGVEIVQYPDKIIIATSLIKGYFIHLIVKLRNSLLYLLGKHVS
jgi:lipid II:glycine glycyltransferase (peptidoglycan interpeptide bridge formation enzyme)